MSKARAEIPFVNQQLMADNKTVQIEIDDYIMLARGDKLEITFSTIVGAFITRIVRELKLPEKP